MPAMPDMQSSTSLDVTPATFSSLPNELLIKILEYLGDDLDLYQQSFLCRSLHYSALGVLFRKYRIEHKLARGSLSLTRQSPFILRAVHSALFLNDFTGVSIQFDLDITKMLSELRMVKNIISRSRCNDILVLKFSKMATTHWMASDHETPSTDFEEFTELLRGVVDAALERGCRYVTVESQSGLSCSNRPSTAPKPEDSTGGGDGAVGSLQTSTPNQQGSQAAEVPPAPKKRRFTLFRQLRRTLSLKSKRKSVHEDSGTANVNITNGSENVEPILSEYVQHQPGDDSLAGLGIERYSRAMQTQGTFNILAEVLLEPTWSDWTLPILNNTPITTFTINTHHFSSSSAWSLSLLRIQMDHLQSFKLIGPKIDLNRVAVFLRRHATTLNEIELKFDSHSPESSIPTSNVLDVDFPEVHRLALTPCCTPWFFNGVRSSSLPKLCKFGIASPSGGHFFHQVDESLKALSSFADLARAANKSGFGGDSTTTPPCSPTLREFEPKRQELDTLSIEFMSSLGIVSWLKTHTKDPSVSPLFLLKLNTVEELSLFPTSIESADIGLFEHIPRFLAVFPSLRNFSVKVRDEVVKQISCLDKGYWAGIKESCQSLETLTFLSKSGLGLPVKIFVDDLIDGEVGNLPLTTDG